MLKKNVSKFLDRNCVIYRPDWACPYKNIEMPISVELGMLITSCFVIKNS